MFPAWVHAMHFGTCIWSFHLSDVQACCSLQGALMLFLSCRASHVALSQSFLAEGWMSLSAAFGGPSSNTHVYKEEKIIMRTWSRWMKLWASSSPHLHKCLDHFLSNYVGVGSDHWFSFLFFDQSSLFCYGINSSLAIPCWSCLQSYPSTECCCTTVPPHRNIRLPGKNLLNITSHPCDLELILLSTQYSTSFFQSKLLMIVPQFMQSSAF